MVVGRHAERIETLAGCLKRAATRNLNELSLSLSHPMVGLIDRRGRVPSPWADHGW